jgi:hypothetical protein
MGNSTDQSDHRVLVKVIQRTGDTPDSQRPTEQRFGEVLLVTSTESKPDGDALADPSVISSRPELASTLVRVVTTDKALNAELDERVIKRMRIGSTLIETIKVGVSVPA